MDDYILVPYIITMIQMGDDNFELWLEIDDKYSLKIYGPESDGAAALHMLEFFNNNPFIVNLWAVKRMNEGVFDTVVGPNGNDENQYHGEHSQLIIILDTYDGDEHLRRTALSGEEARRFYGRNGIPQELLDLFSQDGVMVHLVSPEEIVRILNQAYHAAAAHTN